MALWDLVNSDCVVVMGSNMAENHPVAFRFLVEAQKRGGTLVHVDPRFTRTSALANIHAPIRAGTDIAFLGGIIRHILANDLWFRDFAMAYTNIATIIDDSYRDPEDNDGVFSGFDVKNGTYKHDSWQYQGRVVPSPLSEHHVQTAESTEGGKEKMADSPPPTDPTLQHPNCVYQIMRRHFERYTPEMVERVTGCPQSVFLRVCEELTRNSGPDRTGAFCYAVGWTHHSYGVQIIRAATIIQGLLGNVGRPGGGIMALRGHCSIQGSTDIPTLYNMLPTYLPQPNAFSPHHDLKQFLDVETVPTGWWHNLPKYVVSLLKAWYGTAAQPDNDFCYSYVPKLTGDHSQLPMTLAMVDGVMKGQFVLGQNPVVGAVNSDLVERGLSKLDWLVVRDFAMTETATFWQKGRLVQRGELKPEDIQTEVFYLPSAMAAEKEGSMTNTSRLVQWHDKVCEPPGDARSDLWFIYHLGRRLKELYADSGEPQDAPMQALSWEYPVSGDIAEPDAAAVLREINGYTVVDRQQLQSFQQLKDDGSTACGGWLYTGVFPGQHDNRSRSRTPDGPDGDGSHRGWAFAWPDNRRHAVQPRLGRSGRQAVVGTEETGLVGRRTGKVDRHGHAGLRAEQGARDASRLGQGAEGDGGAGRRRPVHHGSRRQVHAVRAVRPEGWAVADLLRTGRKPGAQSALRSAEQPGDEALAASGQRAARAGRSRLSLCVQHLSPDRAALRRHHHARDAAQRGTAA